MPAVQKKPTVRPIGAFTAPRGVVASRAAIKPIPTGTQANGKGKANGNEKVLKIKPSPILKIKPSPVRLLSPSTSGTVQRLGASPRPVGAAPRVVAVASPRPGASPLVIPRSVRVPTAVFLERTIGPAVVPVSPAPVRLLPRPAGGVPHTASPGGVRFVRVMALQRERIALDEKSRALAEQEARLATVARLQQAEQHKLALERQLLAMPPAVPLYPNPHIAPALPATPALTPGLHPRIIGYA
jgi:hypothetical protein